MLGEDCTTDELYEILCAPEKLKNYQGFQKLMSKGLASGMSFYQELPYDEIKNFIKEERDSFLARLPREMIENEEVKWEHVGSTSIRGMPGTNYPDALVLYNKSPAPKEIFVALIDSGFTFLGPGPMDTQDIWFMKKIERKGSILDQALFKVHFNHKDLKVAQMLIEVRDRCNNNKADFEDYKAVKCKAAENLGNGQILEYKKAKGASKLLQEMCEKYEMTLKL